MVHCIEFCTVPCPQTTAAAQLPRLAQCDDPAGRHLGRGGPTDPPQKGQCRETVRTVLRTGPGVQRPKAPKTNQWVLSLGRRAHVLSVLGVTEQEVLSDKVLSPRLSITPLIKEQGTS